MHRLLVAIPLAALLAGCGTTTMLRGSGNVVAQKRSVPSFDRIELRGSAEVVVTVGGPRAVTVRADDNIVPRIHTDVVGDALVVSQKGSFSTNDGIRVEVTVPSLVGAKLSGSGSFSADGVDAAAFDVTLDGAGSFDLGGSVGRLDAQLNGVGSAALEHLQAKDVAVAVNGTGSAHVYATRSLDAAVRGVGSVLYAGDPPRVHETVTGLGSIVKS